MSPATRSLALTIAALATPLADAQPRAAAPMRLVGVTAHGPLRPAAVRTGLQRATSALRTCPMGGFGPRNQLRIAILIDSTGRAFRTRVLDEDGVPFATSSCFAERLQAAPFASSRTNEVTAVEARWTFSVRRPVASEFESFIGIATSAGSTAPTTPTPPPAPLPPPRPNPPIRTGQVAVTAVETDVPEAATRLHVQVARDEAALRGCYNLRLNGWGPAEGTLEFALTLARGAPRHAVVNVLRTGGTLTDREPATCLIEWFQRQVYELDPAVSRATIALRFTMDPP